MTKLAGESLRDSIASLLRIKFQNVTLEKRLTSTTADVFYVDDTNALFPRSIAIEAKDWASRLQSEDLATIHNLYSPSLMSQEIDNLWIIGRHPLSSSPRLSIEKMKNVIYSTFEEFRASLMNFSALLNNNVLLFEHEDASKNFVKARVRNEDKPLFQYVTEWLVSDQVGLMVYGGYGLGKTTFSYHLASALSKNFLAGEFDRIPIRISLGGMYSKQDIVALICSALSGGESGVTVKDFSFGLFLEMNHQGQYLLILDGFDEMRHAMDLEDFVYTFEQMKPLFAGKAKIIILGRPDSFLSNQEENAVLSALFDAGSEKEKKLDTVEVAFFSKIEVLGYLDNFLKAREQALTAEQEKNYQLLMSKLPDNEDGLLSRPVQLKMFTKIIDECLSTDIFLNRYELYKRFIYNFIERESRKLARQPNQGGSGSKGLKDARASFMQAVAWWLLNEKKENRFVPEDIPIDIIPPALRVDRSSVTAIREAIVGSVIEPTSRAGVLGSKAKRYYYFPHKSYLEFLVANYFEANEFSVNVYREFMGNINNEILTFLEEGPARGVKNLREGLTHNVGSIDPRIVEICAGDPSIAKEVDNKNAFNRRPNQIYTHYFYFRAKREDSEAYLLARLADSNSIESVLATFVCIAGELREKGSQNLGRAVVMNCLTSIPAHNIRRCIEADEKISVYRADGEGLRAAIIGWCVFSKGSGVRVSTKKLAALLEAASRGSFYVPIPGSADRDDVIVPIKALRETFDQEYQILMEKLLDKGNRGPILTVVLHDQALRFAIPSRRLHH
jgi:hypothetical protein